MSNAREVLKQWAYAAGYNESQMEAEADRMYAALTSIAANQALKDLLRNLTDVRTQRGVPRTGATRVELERQRGEINGLNIAIAAVKRRIR